MYWFDLATTHYAVVLLEGVVLGYVLKYALDALFTHLASRRERKVEDIESMMEEMFWQGASAQSRLGVASDDTEVRSTSVKMSAKGVAALPTSGNKDLNPCEVA